MDSFWRRILQDNGHCILVVGDTSRRRAGRSDLAERLVRMATKLHDFSLVAKRSNRIPNDRRVRRGKVGSTSETIVVLRKGK